MKVKELIQELEKLDPDLEVSTEGCDCNGDVASLATYPATSDCPAYVVLERSPTYVVLGRSH